MGSVAVIGEVVVDAFLGADGTRLDVRPGGGPANTAVALARLGTPTRFLGRLSGGPFGTLLREHLVASGVDVSGCVDADENATLAVAAVDGEGKASYEFYVHGTADWQWTREELDAGVPDDAIAVHTGSLALAIDPGGPRIEELLDRVRSGRTVSVDPNARPGIVPPDVYRERMRRWTRRADIVRLSDEDLAVLGDDFDDACAAWHEDGVALVVLTLGADGAVASLRGERVAVPAADAEVADTVGAGDAFMGGMLHALRPRLGGRLDDLALGEVKAALEFAAWVAGETVKVPGADPPRATGDVTTGS